MKTRLRSLLVCALLAATLVTRADAADPAPAAVGDLAQISQAELLKHLEARDADVVVLDVRTPEEFASGHVPGARNLSHDQLATRLDELASLRDKQVVLYCRSGRRSLLAADTLRKAGFGRLLHLQGDFQAWQAAQQPIER